MIKKLYDRCVELARHKFSKPLLAFFSFIESSFFTIPPDVMIIPMVVADKKKFLLIALIATVFSALGALFGYLIGYLFFSEIGVKIFELYGVDDSSFLKNKISSDGGIAAWATLLAIAGFTPIPFKLLTITSGFVQFNFFYFVVVCLATRGSRFFIIAFLVGNFGLAMKKLIEKKLMKISLIISITLIIFIYFVYNFMSKFVS